jgi:YHS domain-containing protein
MFSIIRFLVVVFVFSMGVRFVLSVLGGFLRPSGGPSDRRQAPSRGTSLVRDRVCNTFLPQDRAVRAVIDGREEYFCSEACRAKALTEGAGSPPVVP